MSILPWSSLMSVRNPLLDNQHKYLLQVINDVYAGVVFGRAVNIFAEEFPGLLEYAKVHFKTEELLMDAAGYEGLSEHVKQHEILLAKLEETGKKVAEDVTSVDFEYICSFLGNWLTNHMMREDQGYVDDIAMVGQDVYDRIEQQILTSASA